MGVLEDMTDDVRNIRKAIEELITCLIDGDGNEIVAVVTLRDNAAEMTKFEKIQLDLDRGY